MGQDLGSCFASQLGGEAPGLRGRASDCGTGRAAAGAGVGSSDPASPQIIKKLIERKQAQIRKVYPGLSCFKEGVRQIPVESVPGIREQGAGRGGRGGAACLGCVLKFLGLLSPLFRRDGLEAAGEGEGVSVVWRGRVLGEAEGPRASDMAFLAPGRS